MNEYFDSLLALLRDGPITTMELRRKRLHPENILGSASCYGLMISHVYRTAKGATRGVPREVDGEMIFHCQDAVHKNTQVKVSMNMSAYLHLNDGEPTAEDSSVEIERLDAAGNAMPTFIDDVYSTVVIQLNLYYATITYLWEDTNRIMLAIKGSKYYMHRSIGDKKQLIKISAESKTATYEEVVN